MFRVICIALLISAAASETCKGFKNVKATIWTGSELDPQNVKLSNGMEEAKEAYRIEIVEQDVPELCEGAVKGLKDLDTLIIKDSGINKIEKGAFEQVPHLRIVDLSENAIKSVPSGIFKDMGIRRLNLSSNSISKIDSDAFENMNQLQVLELDANYIKEIDPKWFKLPKLYRVTMDHNDITEIPKDAFKSMGESKGRDRDLDIWMSNNKINNIHPLAFRGVNKFETLWLSSNEIREIKDFTFEGIENVHSLYLDNNKLVCLSDELLKNLHVDELNIDVNPLNCDCLRKMRKWSQKKNVELISARRGFSCLRDTIDAAILSQKQYYEEKITDLKF